MSIVITAPTGNIGSRLVELLLEANADLTLLVRDPNKLAPSVRNRVKVEQGDLQDAAFVTHATQGAEALFLLAPPNFGAQNVHAYYQAILAAAVGAVQANQIPHLVFISSGGAGHSKAGLVTEVAQIEKALDATEANVLSLHCGSFMENFKNYLPTLRDQGAYYGINRPDLPLPLVATDDIAAVAAQKLLDLSWQGKLKLAVHGAVDVTPDEAAHILTQVLGKPIHYVQIPSDALRQSLLQMGATPDVAANYIEMLEAFDTGIYSNEPRTEETTTPTTFEHWAEEVLKPILSPVSHL